MNATTMANAMVAVMSSAPLRASAKVPYGLWPQEDEGPATLPGAQFHRHAASSCDLLNDIVEPAIVQGDILDPSERGSQLCPPKVRQSTNSVPESFRVRVRVRVSQSFQYPGAAEP